MISVDLGGIVFQAGDDHPLMCQRLDGWYSGAPMRGSLADRPASDGAFGVSRVFKSARQMTFRGFVSSESELESVTLWGSLAAIQAGGSPFVLTVLEVDGPRSCVVTVNGSVAVNELNPREAEVVIPLLAPDPVKYGPTMSVSSGLPSGGGEGFVYPAYDPDGFADYGALGSLGRVMLSNAGTADVWPVFEVADEHVVVIDSASGEVIVDGQSDGGASLLRAEWFPVPAGQSITVQFGLVDGGFEVKCIETGQAVQVARSVGSNPVLTVFSASGWW